MPWTAHNFVPIPLIVLMDWKNDIELKKCFAIALAEGNNPFEAGCKVFGKETNKALYASTNWINDPIIDETKQEYASVTSEPQEKLLDKEEYCRTLLVFSKEKIVYNGNEIYAAEAKDRLKALEIYGRARGFINDKATEINNNINNKNNFMEIKFVEPEKKDVGLKTIDNSPSIEPENILENSPIKLKLVG